MIASTASQRYILIYLYTVKAEIVPQGGRSMCQSHV